MPMMKCPHCGANKSDKRDYCYQCDGQLRGKAKEVTATSPPAAVAPKPTSLASRAILSARTTSGAWRKCAWSTDSSSASDCYDRPSAGPPAEVLDHLLAVACLLLVLGPARSEPVCYTVREVAGLRLHVITADIQRSARVHVDPAVAQRGCGTSESFSSFVSRLRPVAAVNGTFFSKRDLRPRRRYRGGKKAGPLRRPGHHARLH